ncbi:inovirus-type Gp2 protein [Salmonella enterica]|nr:inovirus Gp2 family protein [Salmonella enterica]EBT2371815.1 inovirus Gp2 family protein [Salmonella enterica]ECK6278219.1 inovirus Gp2 family protein [Salmonella enterica]EDQ7909885.1 inovirus Gp2 family protein [Salmonella enterica]EFV1988088.1 inovirus Gp2 family protein [Salmonella enterica]
MNLPDNVLSSHADIHIDNNQLDLVITTDHESRDQIESLDICLKNLSKGHSLPFTLMFNRTGYKQNEGAIWLLDALRYLDILEKAFLDNREVNPRIAVFRRLLNQTDLRFRVHYGKILPSDPITTAELLNRLTQGYRSAVRHADFKKASKKYKRASVQNLKGAWNYIRHLQSRYSRLLVLRVDLSWSNEHKSAITADDARKHRQQLFRNMQKNPLFRHVLGTVWKLEYAPQRKFHYHMLFILNGNKAQQDGVIAHAFGEYWKHTITKGKGIYYNCNANKALYEECCLSKLKRGDNSKDKGLLQALSYITKIDACARLVLPGNARTFGRGEINSLKARLRRK